MKVLVTGGAGYIGSAVTAFLIDNGYEVTILDNLSNGNLSSIDKRSRFIQGDILKIEDLETAMSDSEAVVHLAGKISVEESFKYPDIYMQNNYEGTKNVLNVMKKLVIRKIIFASTCAVYGEAENSKINETTKISPINPYGVSKLKADQEISIRSKNNEIDAVSFRFFNASGAYKSKTGVLYGELHKDESHLIPKIIQNKEISINGADYPTFDGTCIRDYIHVADIANAIEKALYLDTEKLHKIYNLGSEKGYSILEIIDCVEKTLGITVKRNFLSRRMGDSPILVSDSSLVTRELRWQAAYNLDSIIQSAVEYYRGL